MARRATAPPPFHTLFKYSFLLFVTLVSLFFAPILIDAYYPPPQTPRRRLPMAHTRLRPRFFALCIVLAATMLSILVNDARLLLARVFTRPDGVAVPPPTILGRLFLLFFAAWLAYCQIAREHLVSLDRPVPANVVDVALYLLRGVEVLFAPSRRRMTAEGGRWRCCCDEDEKKVDEKA
ncbi:hypothetical protein R3P38DRAFT_2894909 [Favolaschia claudopus]|uniref:Uncharacterized protein n=1 Tax=Favolaschia claudopus TaxID=2862362 RepID=A0AAW0CMZ0_9AGAR